MIIHECEQGTEKWLRLRMGKPTASCFDKIITAKTAELSSSADSYAYELLAEWIVDHPITGPQTDFMERGHELEDAAVDHYEFTTGIETERAGFVTTDDLLIGCSPDRLVGANNLLEIKSHPGNPGIHVAFMSGKALDIRHRQQLQGALWVCERQVIDVISYHPEMPPVIVPVERDEEYIGKLAKAVRGFVSRLMEIRLDLDRKYGIEDRIVEMRKRRAEGQDIPGGLGVSQADVDAIWEYSQRQ